MPRPESFKWNHPLFIVAAQAEALPVRNIPRVVNVVAGAAFHLRLAQAFQLALDGQRAGQERAALGIQFRRARIEGVQFRHRIIIADADRMNVGQVIAVDRQLIRSLARQGNRPLVGAANPRGGRIQRAVNVQGQFLVNADRAVMAGQAGFAGVTQTDVQAQGIESFAASLIIGHIDLG